MGGGVSGVTEKYIGAYQLGSVGAVIKRVGNVQQRTGFDVDSLT